MIRRYRSDKYDKSQTKNNNLHMNKIKICHDTAINHYIAHSYEQYSLSNVIVVDEKSVSYINI